MMCMKSEKIDAAYVTDDTSVEATNIEPPMAPSNSTLKTGLVTMLWCYVIVISVCYAIVLLGGAMSAADSVLEKREERGNQKNLAARHIWNSYVDFRPILRVHI